MSTALRGFITAFAATALLAIAPCANALTIGAPADCLSNSFCDFGLRDQYGVTVDGHFKALPTGPPLYAALDRGDVDVAVAFTTSPQVESSKYVQLIDDRHMIGQDNVVPIFEQPLIAEHGKLLTDRVNAISRKLHTSDLRQLNADVLDGVPLNTAVERWLRDHGFTKQVASKGGTPVIFVSQAFRESRILTRLYARGLIYAGVPARVTPVRGFRNVADDTIFNTDANASVGYAASTSEYFNGNRGFASKSVPITMKVLRAWLAIYGMTSTNAASAVNHNVFIVTRATAARFNLHKLSDLRRMGLQRTPMRANPSLAKVLPNPNNPTSPVLSLGSRNDYVGDLQHRLRIIGFKLEVSSLFNVATKSAVQTMQKRAGLRPDGIVGARTFRAIVTAAETISKDSSAFGCAPASLAPEVAADEVVPLPDSCN